MKDFLSNKLSQINKVAEEKIAQRRAEKIGKKYINLQKTPINIEALSLLSEEEAKKSKILVIERKTNKLAVATLDSQDPETKKTIENLELKNFEVAVFIISKSGLEYGLNFYKYTSKEKEDISGKIEVEEQKEINSIEDLQNILNKQEFLGSKTAEIFEIILNAAIKNRASDIHLESGEKNALLRFRIDGVLRDIFKIQNNFYPFLISRIKLLSNLKINITGEPQDGRFTIKLFNKNIEVRVAVAPAQFGEVVVMRILDPEGINISLKELGLRDDDYEIIEKELKRPNGMILNTGPTGSGKTTTLYAFLNRKKTPEIKIITIEDPVEYRLEGIEQTQVDEEAGYTFAKGLRSLMRQDPDVILVGEIRDKETGEIGVQAALTGHLVFSTVHANSAAGAIPRLLDLEVKPQSIAPALNLIIGQRLIRRLCEQCKISENPSDDLKIKINNFIDKLPDRVNKNNHKEIKIFSPKGCLACNNSGYKKRIAIYELFLMRPEMEELIIKQASENSLKEFAQKNGMTTMQEDGILKAISGTTTFEEIESVTGPIEWKA